MIPSQMLKGTLEGCVLAIIGRSETYGYEIADKLGGYGFGMIAEGTIYPLLLRLEKNGLVHTTQAGRSCAALWKATGSWRVQSTDCLRRK